VRSSRYQQNLEKCLSHACAARTPEIKELWLTMADSYRGLLESEKQTLSHQLWLERNTPLTTK
jgi:hypothetical protein